MTTDNKHRILVIAPVAMTRYTCRSVLSTAGYEVRDTDSAEQGLGMIQEADFPFDLIITDIHLSGMSGFDLLQELRAEPLYSRVPVMVLTSESRQPLVRQAVRLGAADYLQKPFSNSELRQRVTRLLGQPDGTESAEETPLERVLRLEMERSRRGQLDLSLVLAQGPGTGSKGSVVSRLVFYLQGHLRVIDSVVPLGWWGVAAVLPLTDRHGAEVVLRKMAQRLPVNWVLGIASYPGDGETPAELLGSARLDTRSVQSRETPWP